MVDDNETPEDETQDNQPDRAFEEVVTGVVRVEMLAFKEDIVNLVVSKLNEFTEALVAKMPDSSTVAAEAAQLVRDSLPAAQPVINAVGVPLPTPLETLHHFATPGVVNGVHENGVQQTQNVGLAGNATEAVVGALKSDPVGMIKGLAEEAFNLFIKYQDTVTRRSDPFAWWADLAQNDPMKARYLAMTAIPHDPVEERMPALVATTIEKTISALARGKLPLGGFQGGDIINPLESQVTHSNQPVGQQTNAHGAGARPSAGMSVKSWPTREDTAQAKRPRSISEIRELI